MESWSVSIVQWSSRRWRYIQYAFFMDGQLEAAFTGKLEKHISPPGGYLLVDLQATVPGKYAIYDDTDWASELLKTYQDASGMRAYLRS